MKKYQNMQKCHIKLKLISIKCADDERNKQNKSNLLPVCQLQTYEWTCVPMM